MAYNMFAGTPGSSGLFTTTPTGQPVVDPQPYFATGPASGLYSAGSSESVTYFEWMIFNTSDSVPATPTGGSWNFSTNSGIAPVGWLSSPPADSTYAVWMSTAVVDSRNPTTITWSAPGKYLMNKQIYVSATPPANPAINDLWYDLGA